MHFWGSGTLFFCSIHEVIEYFQIQNALFHVIKIQAPPVMQIISSIFIVQK